MKRSVLVSAVALLYVANVATSATIGEGDKKGKVVFLFNVVKFKNDPCASTSTLTSSGTGAGHRNGTCYTETECRERNGISAGGCASGFGICCVFMLDSCDGIVKQNLTYIRNPGFPTSVKDLKTCKFTIQKANKDVCSLRLDFEAFNLIGPTDTVETLGGTCTDSFVATSTGTAFSTPVICGENSGMHVYMDLGTAETSTGALAFTFDMTKTSGRQFEMKVTQIPCNSPSRPPDGCLQYFTGTDGKFTTFNFAPATGHLSAQKYNVCIRQEAGFCCTKYSVCEDAMSFTLDIIKDMAADFASVEDEKCLTDYIMIEASTSTCSKLPIDTANRYCGQFLADAQDVKGNLEICDCTPPFRVGIVTDKTADMKSDVLLSRGLCLNYVQVPC